MATIRSLTSEKIYAIEAATVVDAEVRGDDLVLITHDGTEINVGSIRGPVGASGDHNTLLNLDLDNHPQYLLVNGSRGMSGPLVLSADPNGLMEAATKQYANGRGASMMVSRSIPTGTATPAYKMTYKADSFIGWGGVVRSADSIVCPVAGWYKMSFMGAFGSNDNGTIRMISLGTDNDSTGGSDSGGASPGPLGDITIMAHTANPVFSTSGYGAGLSAFGVGYVPAAGTKVCAWARQDSGVALVANARFTVELIRVA